MYRQTSNISHTKSQSLNVCRLSRLAVVCPIHFSEVLSLEWRCSWSNVDRLCSNYIRVIKNVIAYYCAICIRGFTVHLLQRIMQMVSALLGFAIDRFYSYPSGLLYWQWDSHRIIPVPVEQPGRILGNEFRESTWTEIIITTKQRTIKLCAKSLFLDVFLNSKIVD